MILLAGLGDYISNSSFPLEITAMYMNLIQGNLEGDWKQVSWWNMHFSALHYD